MTLTLTFQGHSKSNLMMRLESKCMISYQCLVSNLWPNLAHLRDIRLRNLSDPTWTFQGQIPQSQIWWSHLTPNNDFLLVFNNNIWPNSALLWDMTLKYISNLEFDLSMSLKVKSNSVVGFPIYDFLLVSNNNMSTSHRLEFVATRFVFSFP